MAALIHRRPGERWVPDINASADAKKGGGPFAVEMDGWRSMRFGE